jgi:hypothetical protein
LLDNTRRFTLDEDTLPRWLPSLFVRRHLTLPLRID